MNPLSALIEPLERLITEHGSAAILREHLALLKTQASILETKITELNSENQNLKAEVKDLRQKIDNCQKINEQLKQELANHNTPPASASSEPTQDDYHAKRKRLIFLKRRKAERDGW